MLLGIAQRKGFIQITGEVGAGKSTSVPRGARGARRDRRYYATALILNPVMTGVQLLRSILARARPGRPRQRPRPLLQRLNEFLLERGPRQATTWC